MSTRISPSTVIKGEQREQRAAAAPFPWHDLSAGAAVQPAEQSVACADFERRVADEVARRFETLVPAVRAAVDGIERAQLACRTEWEQRLIHLATAMAARVIRRELRQSPQITLDLVREAVQMASGSPQLRIELNPDDHVALGDQVTALANECSRAATVVVVASAGVSPGGCRIETRFGTIDQQIETQLARLDEELN